MSEVDLVLRFGLGAVFFPAGLAKLVNLTSFEAAVRDYRLVPPRMTGAVAVVVPVAEALVGVLLLAGALVRVAAAMAALLLAVFSLAVAVNVVRGRRVSCGCVGTLGIREISSAVLLRNAVLGAAAVVVLALSSSATFVGLRDSGRHLTEEEGVAMLVVGTLCMFVLSIADEAVRLSKSHRAVLRARART